VDIELLTERHAARIEGVLGCWDRMLIFGTLPGICFAGGMTSFLYELVSGEGSMAWRRLTEAACHFGVVVGLRREPLTLSVDVTDDGYPKLIARKTPRDPNRAAGGDLPANPARRLRL
jgi:hypothetical protein